MAEYIESLGGTNPYGFHEEPTVQDAQQQRSEDPDVIYQQNNFYYNQNPGFNPATPGLAPPTVDVTDSSYSEFDDVLAEMKKLTGEGEIDPELYKRFESHLNQLKDLLSNKGDVNLEAFLIALLSILGELRAVLKEVGIKDLQTQNEAMRSKNEEQMQKLLQSLESMAKAKNGGLFAKIFGWIAMAAMAVFLVASVIATGGMTTPALLTGIALGISLLMAVDSQFLDNKMMKGITGGNEKAMEILTYVLIAITIILSLAAAVSAAGGIAQVANNARNLASNVMQAISTKSLAPLLQKAAQAGAQFGDDAIQAAATKAAAKAAASGSDDALSLAGKGARTAADGADDAAVHAGKGGAKAVDSSDDVSTAGKAADAADDVDDAASAAGKQAGAADDADDVSTAGREGSRGADGADDAANRAGHVDVDVTNDDWLIKLANKTELYSFYIQQGATIGQATSEIVVATHERDASNAEADMKILQSALRMIEEMISMVSEMLKTVNDSEVATAEFVSEMTKLLKDAKNHTARSV